MGNEGSRLWSMRNGYAMCKAEGLREIRRRLAGLSEADLEELRGKLRIGLHWDVEVTDEAAVGAQKVSQAFCSALPVAYGSIDSHEWEPFATLVLEAAYEATMLAGMLNAMERGTKIVLLTRLGGGAFGNEAEWIQRAMRRALAACLDRDLDVRLVCRDRPDPDSEALLREFS